MSEIEITIQDVKLRKPVICPWCKEPSQEVWGLNDIEKPAPGDAFFCVECGKFSIWLGANDLRKPDADEIKMILDLPLAVAAWLAWRLEVAQAEKRRRHGTAVADEAS